MPVIRAEQFFAMEEALASRFDDELARHISSYAPFNAGRLESGSVGNLVRLAKQRAAEAGFTYRENIRLYLDLMFLLGSGFATDPQYPWIADILAPGDKPQECRADALHVSVIRYTSAVFGERREFLYAALERVIASRVQELTADGTFAHAAVSGLRAIYPEKCSYLGESMLRSVIQRAGQRAERYAMSTESGIALFAMLLFLLGHEFDSDPTAPWVADALRDSIGLEPRFRVQKLHEATRENIAFTLKTRRPVHELG